jgi:cell division protein FtsI (penicillin-binding protein 3)
MNWLRAMSGGRFGRAAPVVDEPFDVPPVISTLDGAVRFDGVHKARLQAGRIRIAALLSSFAMGFLALGVRAADVALFSADRITLHKTTQATPVRRADIVDRNGELLAATLATYSLYVDPSDVWDPVETREALLTVFPDMDPKKIDKALTAKSHFQWLRRNLTPKQKQAVFALGQPGLDFMVEESRIYPRGHLAAHTLGYVGQDNVGQAGAELAFDRDILRDGGLGRPIELSLDMRVQFALDDELRRAMEKHQAKGAIGIVSDVTTGEILGMVSLPDYDPNTHQRWGADNLMNRTATAVYEMGSTFKIFTVAMGLDEGIVTLDSTYDASRPLNIGGRVIHDYHAENRTLTVQEIFTHSSNIGSARLAMDAGVNTTRDFMKRMGFFRPAPIELAESARPILPVKWDESTVASVSFGHAMSVSPLSLVAAVGGLMNGGRYVPLTLKKRDPGDTIKSERIVSAATSEALLQLMRANVTNGTGTKAEVPGYRVGGKTGTAEKTGVGGYDRSRLLSSFVAVFPTDKPRYLVTIIIDEPKASPDTYGFATGGWTAAPAVGRVIARIGPILGVERRFDIPLPAPVHPVDATAKVAAMGNER